MSAARSITRQTVSVCVEIVQSLYPEVLFSCWKAQSERREGRDFMAGMGTAGTVSSNPTP